MSARRVSMLRGSSVPRPRASRVSQVNAPAACGGEQRPQRRHAVGLGGDDHAPVAAGLAVALLGAVGVGGDHGTREGGLELGEGLLGCAG